MSKFILFSPHHFLKVSDLNSNPASDLMCDIFFILLPNIENFDMSCSMPSIHASDVLSLIPIVLFIISLVALVVMILGFIIKSEVIFKTSRGYFIPLFLIFILRTFMYEPYQVPSGSMIPGLKVGDFLLVNKFDYGLKIARTSSNTIFKNDPEYGDVVVFIPPHNPVPYVKRLIGKPGDKILYYQKRLFVNGNEVPINFISEDNNAKFYEQSLNNKNFVIRVQEFDEFSQLDQVYRAVVPDGMYFVMGDNRDRSSDSRIWGFVPREN